MDLSKIRLEVDAIEVAGRTLSNNLAACEQRLVQQGETVEALEEELAIAKAKIAELEGVIDPVPLPPPPPAGYGVLYNADTDQPLANLVEGVTYPIAGQNISVVAMPNPDAPTLPASVRFVLDGTAVRVENSRPWSMWGDASGNLAPGQLAVGPHEISLEFFSAANAGGDLLGRTTYHIDVTAKTGDLPPPIIAPEPIPDAELISNITDLVAAVRAGGNRTLAMVPGSYPDVSLAALGSESNRIIITSANPSNRATFRNIDMIGAKHLTLKKLKVEKSTTGLGTYTNLIKVGDTIGVEIIDCDITGFGDAWSSMRAVYGSSRALRFKLLDCRFKDCYFGYLGGGKDIVIAGNTFYNAGTDCVQLGSGVNGAEVTRNYFHHFRKYLDSHCDGIQLGTWSGNPSSNLHIHHNVMFVDGGSPFQAVFCGNEKELRFDNFVIENNLICNQHFHGISVYAGGGTGLVIRNNTVLSEDTSRHQAWIAVENSPGATVERNIANKLPSGAVDSYVAKDRAGYDKVFVDYQPGVWTLENFRTKVAAGADVDQLIGIIR